MGPSNRSEKDFESEEVKDDERETIFKKQGTRSRIEVVLVKPTPPSYSTITSRSISCAALVDRGGPYGLPKVKIAQRTTGEVRLLVMATWGHWSDPWRTLSQQRGSPGRWIAPAGGCGVDVVLCCSTTYRRRACRSCLGMAWMSRRGVSTWRCVDVGVPFARTLRRPPPSWPSWHVMVRHRAETSDTALSSTDTP
ncbi:hypothetical protein HDK90DRAFT_227812 [Phyllosticta capitalensis]|uniref:Uncharacterized protein n=1 Tax=Phyllosticta capitalensis TaxID=121624 RepID=A0ABR1YU60_9PEZI